MIGLVVTDIMSPPDAMSQCYPVALLRRKHSLARLVTGSQSRFQLVGIVPAACRHISSAPAFSAYKRGYLFYYLAGVETLSQIVSNASHKRRFAISRLSQHHDSGL